MVRLDQDVAGRLLEGPSDRPPRGMTVRTEYRPTEPGLQAAHWRKNWPLVVILPQEASYHIDTMGHLQILLISAGLLCAIASCSPGASLPPVPTPPAPRLPVPNEPHPSRYSFVPNVYQYHFQQVADIQEDGATDTLPSRITTRAVLTLSVTAGADSSITVDVSIDSISITSEGSIPPRGLQQISALDSVISATFSPTRSFPEVKVRFADSLCAYSQFLMTARELLLPELGIELLTPTKHLYRDTVTHYACRAGIGLTLITTRELRDVGSHPPELLVQQQTAIQGRGSLRRDSLSINGSVMTRGTIFFTTVNRLPSSVQTTSEGIITVHLGSITTTFRQISTQQLWLKATTR